MFTFFLTYDKNIGMQFNAVVNLIKPPTKLMNILICVECVTRVIVRGVSMEGHLQILDMPTVTLKCIVY